MDLENVIADYFDTTFTENFFTVGINRTGCYLFTDYQSDDVIAQEYAAIKQATGFNDEQFCLCVLERESTFNYCALHRLPDFLRVALQTRDVVLSESQINEILDFFGCEETKRVSIHDSDTFRKISFFCSRYGYNLTDKQKEQICTGNRNWSELGIHDDVGDRLIQFMLDPDGIIENEPIEGPNELRRLAMIRIPDRIIRYTFLILGAVSTVVALANPTAMVVGVPIFLWASLVGYSVGCHVNPALWIQNLVIALVLGGFVTFAFYNINWSQFSDLTVINKLAHPYQQKGGL